MKSGEFIWAEKYRPSKLDDVIIPAKTKEEFASFVVQKQIPNLLLTSPSPGTGKTTTAYALCNELGVSRPLFINASMNNSIDDIRTTVMQYATSVSLTDSTKIVILDEADRLSAQAQDSLKGLIELVSSNCRFILTANTKSRISEPLRSRCTEIDYIYTNEDNMRLAALMCRRVCQILEAENVTYKMPVVVQVVKKYIPDNRKILNVLQQYAASANTVDEGILGKLASGDATTLIASMKAKNFNEVKKWCFDNHDRLMDDFYGKLMTTLEGNITPQSEPQAFIVINLSQQHHNTVPDKFIHFTALCTELMLSLTFK